MDLSLKQRQDAARALRILAKGTLEQAIRDYTDAVSAMDGTPLKDAVDFYRLHHRPAGGTSTVLEFLDRYVATKAKKNCRDRTIRDIRFRIGRFGEQFGTRHVHTITPAEIEAWMDSHEFTGQNRINYLRVLSGFFNHARKLKLVAVNPAAQEEIERPSLDERLPGIFSGDQVQRLLVAASKTAPRIIPLLAIGFFAGLRTAELERIGWVDVDFDSKLITVRRGIARILRQTELKWIQDGMRHTFASCHLAAHRDISKTALELGHTGNLDILFNHYRNLVKPADAEAYWRILPPRDEGVVLPFPKTA